MYLKKKMEYNGNQLGRVCNFCIKYIVLEDPVGRKENLLIILTRTKPKTKTKSH